MFCSTTWMLTNSNIRDRRREKKKTIFLF